MFLKVSPGTGKSQRLTSVSRDLIERCGQDIERAAPAAARAEADRHRVQGAPCELGVDVVVRDRVAPRDERPEAAGALVAAAAAAIVLRADAPSDAF